MLASCGIANSPGIDAGAFAEALAQGKYKAAKLFLADEAAANLEKDPEWDGLKNSPNYSFQFLSEKVSGNKAEVAFTNVKGTRQTMRMVLKDNHWMVESIK